MKSFFSIILIFSLQLNTFAEEAIQKNDEYVHVGLKDLRIADKDFSEELNNKRLHDLKAHRHAGYATLGLATLSFATAFMAKKKTDDDRANRNGRMDASDAKNFNLHLGVATLTLASYFTGAYLGINAPKAESMQDVNQIQWHKRLAYIHLPAMILAPLLGYKAYSDYKKGQNPNGIGKLHRPVMMLGVASLFGAAFVAEF